MRILGFPMQPHLQTHMQDGRELWGWVLLFAEAIGGTSADDAAGPVRSGHSAEARAMDEFSGFKWFMY